MFHPHPWGTCIFVRVLMLGMSHRRRCLERAWQLTLRPFGRIVALRIQRRHAFSGLGARAQCLCQSGLRCSTRSVHLWQLEVGLAREQNTQWHHWQADGRLTVREDMRRSSWEQKADDERKELLGRHPQDSIATHRRARALGSSLLTLGVRPSPCNRSVLQCCPSPWPAPTTDSVAMRRLLCFVLPCVALAVFERCRACCVLCMCAANAGSLARVGALQRFRRRQFGRAGGGACGCGLRVAHVGQDANHWPCAAGLHLNEGKRVHSAGQGGRWARVFPGLGACPPHRPGVDPATSR